MTTALNRFIWIVIIIVAYGCYGISKPDERSGFKENKTNSAEISILEKEFMIIGSLTEKLIPKKMSVETDIADWRYEVSYSTPKERVEGLEIDFHFKNDSICQFKFQEIKSWMDTKWGDSSCPKKFCSWEIPSSRNFTSTVLLSNMSNFLNTSTIAVKILENDGRVYRK